jgi:hypothetical protein
VLRAAWKQGATLEFRQQGWRADQSCVIIKSRTANALSLKIVATLVLADEATE